MHFDRSGKLIAIQVDFYRDLMNRKWVDTEKKQNTMRWRFLQNLIFSHLCGTLSACNPLGTSELKEHVLKKTLQKQKDTYSLSVRSVKKVLIRSKAWVVFKWSLLKRWEPINATFQPQNDSSDMLWKKKRRRGAFTWDAFSRGNGEIVLEINVENKNS